MLPVALATFGGANVFSMYATVTRLNVAKARGHIQRLELFQHLVHAIRYVW